MSQNEIAVIIVLSLFYSCFFLIIPFKTFIHSLFLPKALETYCFECPVRIISYSDSEVNVPLGTFDSALYT